MQRAHHERNRYLLTAWLLGLAVVAYIVGLALGWPDKYAATIDHAVPGITPPLISVLPFAALLAAIAVLPLSKVAAHWWERNRNKFLLGSALGAFTLLYLAFWPPIASPTLALHTFERTLVDEYVPFIVLLFALYTISGGIRIHGDLPAHALTNTSFIAAGGLLASLIGTTGAAMLLIRPLLETNSERKHVTHTVVFFIFVACNCGGLLLPLGDPPLFLGYLAGVDFLWTLGLWKSWLFVNGWLLLLYFVVDHHYYYPREAPVDIAVDETRVVRLQFEGLWPNALLLLGVVLAVGLLDPAKTLPGVGWQPWFYLREATLLGLAALSLVCGLPATRVANRFDFHPIVEVAALFAGIFITMQPALMILRAEGANLGLETPRQMFWAAGWLSAVLDNAPTYLVFFEAAKPLSVGAPKLVAGVAEPLLVAISMACVYFGAMTYIGNGPNLMVKAIAERSGVRMPSFFGYLVYSLSFLLPILALQSLIFLP